MALLTYGLFVDDVLLRTVDDADDAQFDRDHAAAEDVDGVGS